MPNDDDKLVWLAAYCAALISGYTEPKIVAANAVHDLHEFFKEPQHNGDQLRQAAE